MAEDSEGSQIESLAETDYFGDILREEMRVREARQNGGIMDDQRHTRKAIKKEILSELLSNRPFDEALGSSEWKN